MMSDFQNDLKTGMTLTEALQKHNITLYDAFTTLHKQHDKRKKQNKTKQKPHSKKFIYNHYGNYQIRKTSNGKGKAYGTYRKLYEAKQVRDALIVDGWHQNHVDSICRELGVKRLMGKRNKRYE